MAAITCIFLLLSLVGFSIADEAPGYTLYMQGGESSIREDTNGVMLITIQDLIPYIFLESEKKKLLAPVGYVSSFQLPMNAALVFSGTDGESVSLVQISNFSLSDENNVLTLQIVPLAFYDGDELDAYEGDSIHIQDVDYENCLSVGIIIEASLTVPENRIDNPIESETPNKCVMFCEAYRAKTSVVLDCEHECRACRC